MDCSIVAVLDSHAEHAHASSNLEGLTTTFDHLGWVKRFGERPLCRSRLVSLRAEKLE